MSGEKQVFRFTDAGKGKTKAEAYETTLRGWFTKKVRARVRLCSPACPRTYTYRTSTLLFTFT